MSTAVWITGWVVLFVAVVTWEFFTIFDRDKGDTLSEQVWKLMKLWPSAMLIMALWFWLTWHWFIEPRWFESLRPPVWIDDYIVVLVGAASTYFFKREK